MLNAYHAKIINNQVHWLETPPKLNNEQGSKVIITVMEDTSLQDVLDETAGVQATQNQRTPKRQPPQNLKGLMTFHGDIIDTPEMTEEWFSS